MPGLQQETKQTWLTAWERVCFSELTISSAILMRVEGDDDFLLTVEDLLVSRSVLTVTMKKDAVIKTVGAMIAHFQMAQEPPFVPLCLHSHCLPK